MRVMRTLRGALIAVAAASCAFALTTTAAGSQSREANRQLKDMRADAQQVAYYTAGLKDMVVYPEMDARIEARQLNRIRAQINDMGRRIRRFDALQAAVSPQERNDVRGVTPLVQYMADNAGMAIHYVNSHPEQIWVNSYMKNLHNIYAEANAATSRVKNAENIARWVFT